MPEAAAGLSPRLAEMPYRRLLDLMQARLASTEACDPRGYASVREFVDDLVLIDASLQRHRGEHAGRFAVQRLLWRVRSFGFHLAALDLRQDSAAHDAALAALLGDRGWAERDAADRAGRLHGLLGADAAARVDAGNAAAAATLEVFRSVLDVRRSHGSDAIGLYIISMSRSAADALAPLALARIAGCVERIDGTPGEVPLDIAPLFETVDDLQAAPAVMRELFGDPAYRRHLASRRDEQTVMLGYSDSAKDGGLFASRWALQRTQVELTALANEYGIRLMYFHGRGGSVSRGGGKTEASRTHYRALVHAHPDFPAYFRAATPIDVIERLQIGSRPSRRRDGGIANLRAIPWVFAWSQNRSGLTGWFGIGHALELGIREYGLDAMREMARDWPFFAAMTDDVEMLLAKSDLGIFERYSQLAGDLHEAMYPGIAEEFLRSRDAILAIKDAPQMLDGDYRLRLSIRLRNPYVDPISLLQVDLLCRWREGGREDEALLEALVTTVNGIAAGIQNTG